MFEETPPNQTKTKLTTPNEEPERVGEAPEKMETAEVTPAKEPKGSIIEVSSKEEAGFLSTASSWQSDDSLAPTPMEVELSAPSSGITSPEQAQDGNLTPLSGVSGDRVALEANQATEERAEKESVEVESCRKRDLIDMESCDSIPKSDYNPEPSLGKTSSDEVAMAIDEPADKKTSILEVGDAVEKPVRPQEENSKVYERLEQVETSAVGRSQEVWKTGKTADHERQSADKSEANSEPESVETGEIPAVIPRTVESTDVTFIDTQTSSNGHVPLAADTEKLPEQSVPLEKTERPPLTTEQQEKKKELMDRCIRAVEYCLRRFSQHHKSRYRLAYVYYYSPEHKVTQRCPCVTLWLMFTITHLNIK